MANRRKGDKEATKAKSPKKTRQGCGTYTKFGSLGSDSSRPSKRYRKKYRGQGR